MGNLAAKTRAAVKGIDWCLVLGWLACLGLVWSGAAVIALLRYVR